MNVVEELRDYKSTNPPKPGDIYKSVDTCQYYIIAQVNAKQVMLINLSDGNRYNNTPTDISELNLEDFQRQHDPITIYQVYEESN